MDLNLRSETFGADDQSWIGSRHGLNNAQTATLKTSTFTKSTHYPDGYFKSGIPLVFNSGDKTYSPWASGGTVAGYLLTSVHAPYDGTSNVVGAILEFGKIMTAKLPVTAPDTAGKASNTRFIYA